jgi:hypothetical protein
MVVVVVDDEIEGVEKMVAIIRNNNNATKYRNDEIGK